MIRRGKVLKPFDFRCRDVLNAAAFELENDDSIHLLVRTDDTDGVNRIRRVTEKDGRFIIHEKPILDKDESCGFFGCEDPRVTVIKDNGREKIFVVFTGLSSPSREFPEPRIALAVSENAREYTNLGFLQGLGDSCNKNGTIFPEKIVDPETGKLVYWMYHRPDGRNIWSAISTDLLHWENSKMVMIPISGTWQQSHIGCGTPPFREDEGWLFFYHGVRKDVRGFCNYGLGAALADINNPNRIIARSYDALLLPDTDFEQGLIRRVIFTCGAIRRNRIYRVYYGAADHWLAVAEATKEEIFATLRTISDPIWDQHKNMRLSRF